VTQYVTIVATVALPEDSPLDPDDLRTEVGTLLERWNLALVPTGWSPHYGDVAELSDLNPDDVTVLDMNPPLPQG
jgi:hypothetical protein